MRERSAVGSQRFGRQIFALRRDFTDREQCIGDLVWLRYAVHGTVRDAHCGWRSPYRAFSRLVADYAHTIPRYRRQAR
jgi:hypothetical protein